MLNGTVKSIDGLPKCLKKENHESQLKNETILNDFGIMTKFSEKINALKFSF